MSEGTRTADDSSAQGTSSMDAATPTARQASSMALAGVVIVLVIIAIAGVWWYTTSAGAAAEAEARAKVEELGAFVPGGKDKPATSVNLSPEGAQENIDEIVAALPALTSLTTLDARGAPITDEHLKTIGQIDSLAALILTNTQVTDAGLPHLTGLGNLTNLELFGTTITSEGLQTISEIRSLKTLNIGATEVSGDLAPLAQLSNLEWLLINDLELSDSVVDTLAQMDELSHVTAQGAKISEEAFAELRKQKSDLKIDR